jgi:hypothetical protein
VRSGSVKRVGGAIGEGAAVVPQLHAFLRLASTPSQQSEPAAFVRTEILIGISRRSTLKMFCTVA